MSMELYENSAAEGLKEAKEKKMLQENQVVLVIQDEEEASNDPSRISTSSSISSKSLEVLAPRKPLTPGSNLRQTDEVDSSPKFKVETSFPGQQPSPEIRNFGPALDEPLTGSNSPHMASPCSRVPITPRTPLMASPGSEEGEDEDEEIYKLATESRLTESSRKKLKFRVIIEWIALVCVTGTLVSSLTIYKLEHFRILELHLWKWCVLLLVIVCGRLLTEWFINGLVFLIESNFLLKRKGLYFVYGLKKSVQIFIWSVLVLLSWTLLFHGRIKRSDNTKKILNYVTRALVSLLIGAVIWVLKTILILILAASVNVNSFFDRIRESLYSQYVFQTLSGPPLMEFDDNIGYTSMLSFRGEKKMEEKGGKQVIDVFKLQKLQQVEVSSWTMKLLSNVIITTKFTIISNTLDEFDDGEGDQTNVEITSEMEVMAAAYHIFRNVAKPGCKYIDKYDLTRFLTKTEVDNLLPQFEGAAETGEISRSMLTDWMMKAYLGRKSLVSALKDADIAVQQLNKVVSMLVLVLFVIVWLISMGLATTEVLLFLASQIFIFGNTTKAVFEGIIFVFLTHPFDVGDHCVIDGVQMIVEEINIMRTGFLRYDNQKIYYPNSVLATKTIANMHSSGTNPWMGDAVELDVDASTTMESIEALKARIKTYIESKPQHWNPTHSVVVLGIAESKMKMALYVTHTVNHQNMGEKINRRSDLVLELKKIFEELSIKYDILPAGVPVSFTVQQQQHQ